MSLPTRKTQRNRTCSPVAVSHHADVLIVFLLRRQSADALDFLHAQLGVEMEKDFPAIDAQTAGAGRVVVRKQTLQVRVVDDEQAVPAENSRGSRELDRVR